MDKRDQKIKEAMTDVYNQLIADGHNVLHIYLQGSQNYLLDTDESDYDFKAIVMPSKQDVYKNKQISKIYKTPYGQVEVKDIGLFHNLIYKMNPTYLELLVTPHNYGRLPDFSKYVDQLIFEQYPRFLKSTLGTIVSKYNSVFKATEGTQHILDKYGHQPKELHHFHRLIFLVKDVIQGKPLKEALVLPEDTRSTLLSMKYPPAYLNHSEVEYRIDKDLVEVTNLVRLELVKHVPNIEPFTQELDMMIEKIFYEELNNLK